MAGVSAGELAGIGWPVTGSIVPGEASGAGLSTGEAARIPSFRQSGRPVKLLHQPSKSASLFYIFTDG
jgi:hypothetical protein